MRNTYPKHKEPHALKRGKSANLTMQSPGSSKQKQEMQAFEDESPQEATKKVANTWARTLMPANIKQIIDAWPGRNRSYITINGSPASTIKVVGKLIGIKLDEYKANLIIEDCSGIIRASIWLTWGSKEMDHVKQGAYVTAVGRINLEGDVPELQCYVCRPIQNYNDITHHHLSVIATHIDLVMKPERKLHTRPHGSWAEYKTLACSDLPTANKPPQTRQRRKPIKIVHRPKIEKSSQENMPALSETKEEYSSVVGKTTNDEIMDFLNSNISGPEGVHIEYICNTLKITEEAVRTKIKELAEAGELYTTVDEDHFAPT